MKFGCTFTIECYIYAALLPSPQTTDEITTLRLDWGMTITTTTNITHQIEVLLYPHFPVMSLILKPRASQACVRHPYILAWGDQAFKIDQSIQTNIDRHARKRRKCEIRNVCILTDAKLGLKSPLLHLTSRFKLCITSFLTSP